MYAALKEWLDAHYEVTGHKVDRVSSGEVWAAFQAARPPLASAPRRSMLMQVARDAFGGYPKVILVNGRRSRGWYGVCPRRAALLHKRGA